MLRALCTTFLLGAVVAAQGKDDAWNLDSTPLNSRAKQLRKQANGLWKSVKPAWEKAKTDKPLEPEEVVKAVAVLEDAIFRFERSVELQWHEAANDALANCVRAWFLLYPKLPPPPTPADDKAAEKAKRAAAAVVRKHKSTARNFLMAYAAAQQQRKLYGRCPRCDGRKDLSDPFGGKRACQTCQRKGELPNRKGIVHAKWSFLSPLGRADVRQRSNMNRMLRAAGFDANRLGPYIQKIRIKGKPEFHDTWIRVLVDEYSKTDARSKRYEKQKKYYTLYRAGKTWFLYSRRYDRELVDIPDPPKEEKKVEKDTSMD